MQYAKIENNELVKYPYMLSDMKTDYPNVSFPNNLTADDLLTLRIVIVQDIDVEQPTINQLTHRRVEDVPHITEGQWTKTWAVVELTEHEKTVILQQHISGLTVLIQKYLDDTAALKGYGDRLSSPSLSARSYAGFPNFFQEECIRYSQWVAAVWEACYQFLESAVDLPTDRELFNMLPIFSWNEYDILGAVSGLPNESVNIIEKTTVNGFTLPQDLVGSVANVSTRATGTTVFSIQHNGTQIGTLTFDDTSEIGQFNSTETNFGTGDVLTVVSPALQDATLANLTFTLKAAAL
jgi:hypothetical protein